MSEFIDASWRHSRWVRVRRQATVMSQWLGLAVLVGIACGIASAAFLLSLDYVTRVRTTHEAIVYALPLVGVSIGLLYERWGTIIQGGNNLVIDAVHEDSPKLPTRMGPMVFLGTVFTHLFGGS